MRRLLLLLLLPLAALADELKSFDLQHRSAEELIPILRPMLDSSGAISGSGYTLFIRTRPQNLSELERLIERLDTAQRNLRISVDQGGEQQRRSQGGSVSGKNGQANVRVYGSRRSDSSDTAQRLRVLEGEWATISAGQAVPQVTQRHYQSPHGSGSEQRIEYRNLNSGFEVRPRINGERVTLDVRPYTAAPSQRGGGITEQQEIVTRVSGR
ncbi:MAG: secretin N-terminal domain-containing protein, partial [Pseudomonadota bacterium]